MYDDGPSMFYLHIVLNVDGRAHFFFFIHFDFILQCLKRQYDITNILLLLLRVWVDFYTDAFFFVVHSFSLSKVCQSIYDGDSYRQLSAPGISSAGPKSIKETAGGKWKRRKRTYILYVESRSEISRLLMFRRKFNFFWGHVKQIEFFRLVSVCMNRWSNQKSGKVKTLKCLSFTSCKWSCCARRILIGLAFFQLAIYSFSRGMRLCSCVCSNTRSWAGICVHSTSFKPINWQSAMLLFFSPLIFRFISFKYVKITAIIYTYSVWMFIRRDKLFLIYLVFRIYFRNRKTKMQRNGIHIDRGLRSCWILLWKMNKFQEIKGLKWYVQLVINGRLWLSLNAAVCDGFCGWACRRREWYLSKLADLHSYVFQWASKMTEYR